MEGLGLFKLKCNERWREGDQEKGIFIKGCEKAGFTPKPEWKILSNLKKRVLAKKDPHHPEQPETYHRPETWSETHT